MSDHERTRPTWPLWVRDVPPWPARQEWMRLTGERWDDMPDGYHTGGPWLNQRTNEAWKSLDGRPWANSDCHAATDEDACLKALADRPGFPENWRIETKSQRRGDERVERRWLVRPRVYALGKDWAKEDITLDQVLYIERAVREMNQVGWELNDPLSVALDPDTYDPFLLDLSVAHYTDARDGCYAPDDRRRIIKWLEWLGLDRLVALRENGANVLPRHIIEMAEALENGWPGKEWVHVYASRNRPMSPTWASVPDARYVHDDWGKTGVHTWVVTPTPVSEKKVYDYELTWAHGPLLYDEAPALPKFWWIEEEPCQQLNQ